MFNVFDRNVKGDLDGIDIDDVVTGLFAMVGIEKSIFVFQLISDIINDDD